MPESRSPGRTGLLTVLTAVLASGFTLVALEGAMRVVYLDGGRTTLGGPGGREFEHTSIEGTDMRGPLATGPKPPGIQRIMVFGDSITWGKGVKDWRDTYPVRALQALNADGVRYDMAVYANEGREIDGHLGTMTRHGEAVQPDIVVYQWYVNDVELWKANRPVHRRAWRNMPWHLPLKTWSYLYYVLDYSIDQHLDPDEPRYEEYLAQHYGDDTDGWRAYARTFHGWAAQATGLASRTIMLMYPPTPRSALTDLRARATAITKGQDLVQPPHDLAHTVGDIEAAPDAPAGEALVAAAGKTPVGHLADSRHHFMAHGDYLARVEIKTGGDATRPVAHIEVLAGPDQKRLASLDVSGAATHHTWETISLPFHVEPRVASDVHVQVDYLGAGKVAVGRIAIPVTYNIEVVDLAPHLADFNPATSHFDAHPGARAHEVMAKVLVEHIKHPAGH